MKKIISAFGLYYLLVGAIILFAPLWFYQNTPGVSMMGPYNSHFVIDLSFAFIASGLGLLFGASKSTKSTIVTGALWPFMHALFHISIWIKRELIIDIVSVSDFFAVIVPGVLIFLIAIKSSEAAYV